MSICESCGEQEGAELDYCPQKQAKNVCGPDDLYYEKCNCCERCYAE